MRIGRFLSCAVLVLCSLAMLQTDRQPEVAPGPNEPNWWDILDDVYGLDMFGDLANPVNLSAIETPGLFRKAGPGVVVFEPVIALGTENPTHGGWYLKSEAGTRPEKQELWVYADKNTPEEISSPRIRKPSLKSGSRVEFDPGNQPFGVWVSNDSFSDDFGVFSEPSLVARFNTRLASQPYKAMIYALPDREATYLIGWEYSTNDDFQDVVCIIRNVQLVQ